MAYIQLIRPLNLALALLLMLITRYEFTLSVPWNFSEICFFAAVLLIMAGGNIINDCKDVAEDKINKPGKNPIGEKISLTKGYAFYAGTCITSLCLLMPALSVGKIIAVIICIYAIFNLFFYSVRKKMGGLQGNLSIALLGALLVLIIPMFHSEECIKNPVLITYMSFSFLSSLIREFIKDMEDRKGDKHAGVTTFVLLMHPMVIKFILSMCGAGLLLICILNFTKDDTILRSISLMISTVVYISILGISLFSKEKNTTYRQLSTYTKVYMLVGILTILI